MAFVMYLLCLGYVCITQVWIVLNPDKAACLVLRVEGQLVTDHGEAHGGGVEARKEENQQLGHDQIEIVLHGQIQYFGRS